MIARSPISVNRLQSETSAHLRPVRTSFKDEAAIVIRPDRPLVYKSLLAANHKSHKDKKYRYSGELVGLRRSIMPIQQWADPPLMAPIVASFTGHVCLVLFFCLHFHAKMQGSKVSQVDQDSAMEVVFTPPAHNEMSGEPSANAGGGSPPPTPSQPKKQKKKTANASLAVPDSSSEQGEIQAGKISNKKPDTKESTKEPERKQEQNKEQTKPTKIDKNNPFAHPTNISFPNNQPSPSPKAGRRGGNRRSVDLSTGPLSLNGQINAPYKSTTSIKGVSSEYGEEIDRWIREHLYYPDDAIQNEEEGPTSVHVVLDRSGNVSRVVLNAQSGSYSLDSQTVSMFTGSKLPPVPPDMKGDHFDIDVTVNYILLR